MRGRVSGSGNPKFSWGPSRNTRRRRRRQGKDEGRGRAWQREENGWKKGKVKRQMVGEDGKHSCSARDIWRSSRK